MRQPQQYELTEKPLEQNQANSSLVDSQQLAWKIAETADDKKAGDLVILQVEEVSYLTDYFVIATGFSKTQVRAIADAIETKVEEVFGQTPVRVAGKTEGTWVLQDFGEVIVHIFLPQEREYYNLEAFWGHARRIVFSESNQ